MSYVDLTLLLKVALIIWMAALAASVIIQRLRGDIETSGLLRSETKDGSVIDPERVAMLLVTVLVMGSYVFVALSTDTCNPETKLHQLPDVPEVLLALLAGGNTTYLTGKISRRLLTKGLVR